MLDATFTFYEHLKVISSKINNSLETITKIAKPFAKAVSDNHMQSFVRPHQDYYDSIFNGANNPTFYWKLESVRIMLA